MGQRVGVGEDPRHAALEVRRSRREGMTEEGEICVHLKATGETQAEVGKWAMERF